MAFAYHDGAWSARLPAGVCRAVARPGCPSPGASFVVAARHPLHGVIVWWGCTYS